uniref:Uncharacterized protein n=1 Tax=Anguilla anguilla TaxID=7936 RepID=A0A0E9V942_ANGAN
MSVFLVSVYISNAPYRICFRCVCWLKLYGKSSVCIKTKTIHNLYRFTFKKWKPYI